MHGSVRFAGFFSAARCFAVLGLFGNVFTLAWMLGYTLEKLMDYDPCTVASLITLSFASCECVCVCVCVCEGEGTFPGANPGVT